MHHADRDHYGNTVYASIMHIVMYELHYSSPCKLRTNILVCLPIHYFHEILPSADGGLVFSTTRLKMNMSVNGFTCSCTPILA